MILFLKLLDQTNCRKSRPKNVAQTYSLELLIRRFQYLFELYIHQYWTLVEALVAQYSTLDNMFSPLHLHHLCNRRIHHILEHDLCMYYQHIRTHRADILFSRNFVFDLFEDFVRLFVGEIDDFVEWIKEFFWLENEIVCILFHC